MADGHVTTGEHSAMPVANGRPGPGPEPGVVGAGGRWTALRRRTAHAPWLFAAGLCVALLIANTAAVHGFWESAAIAATLANAAPLMLAGVACTPAMLLGGIDISVGPLMGFVDVALIVWLEPAGLSSAWLGIPLILLMGAAVGLLNGFLVGYVRVPAIVVTLGTYLFLVGLSVTVMPTPEGSMPSWLTRFAGQFGPVPGALILILVPLLAWWAFSRSRLYTEMLAVGDSEKAAFTAGIPVARVKLIGYGIGGVIGSVAGLALSALVGSGDPSLGSPYTLIAIAAAVFGGTSLAGGRGSTVGSALGGLAVYLIEALMLAAGLSAFWVQVAYGALLLFVLAVVGSATSKTIRRVR